MSAPPKDSSATSSYHASCAPRRSGFPWAKACFAVVAGVTFLYVVFLLMLFFSIHEPRRIRGGMPEALALAQEHPGLQDAIGTPVTAGYWADGVIVCEGDTGESVLTVPLYGSRGDGVLFLSAAFVDDRWELVSVVFSGDQYIVLLDRADAFHWPASDFR